MRSQEDFSHLLIDPTHQKTIIEPVSMKSYQKYKETYQKEVTEIESGKDKDFVFSKKEISKIFATSKNFIKGQFESEKIDQKEWLDNYTVLTLKHLLDE